jgi:hypothetical protein
MRIIDVGSKRDNCLLRQLFSGLFAHHVFGVPIRPVRIGLPNPRLMLPMRSRGAPQRLR